MNEHMPHSLNRIPLNFRVGKTVFFSEFIDSLTDYLYMLYKSKKYNRVRHGAAA